MTRLAAAFLLALLALVLAATPAKGIEDAVEMNDDPAAADDATAFTVDDDADDADAAAAAEEIASEAAEEEEVDHPHHILTNIQAPGPAVEVRSIFRPASALLENDALRLVSDRSLEALLALANGDDEPYVVWGVAGSLNAVDNFRTHVQNFSWLNVNDTVKAGEEMSLAYRFTPAKQMTSKDYTLALTVFYDRIPQDHPDHRYSLGHATTFYNATVALVETDGVIDNRPFYMVSFLLLASIVGGIFGYAPLMKQLRKRKRSGGAAASATATIEMGTSKTAAMENNEWLSEHRQMLQSTKGKPSPSEPQQS